ncbi:MAG: response regulator [Bdellovibrionota bacterium]
MKKILIVDDEQGILDVWVMQIQLWKLPVEIHTATNGLDALQLVTVNGNYDAIITDYRMPVMDGLEFIRRVKENERHISTPIFFFTGFMPELTSHIDRLNNVMLFEKPMISEKMKTYIRMAICEDVRPIEAF